MNVNATMDGVTQDVTDYYFMDVSICPGYTDTPKPGHCPVYYDKILCWPETKAGTWANLTCPNKINQSDTYVAYRYCPQNGSWDDVLTDYNMCLETVTEASIDYDKLRIAQILKDIYFILSSVSLVLLLITIFIFQYFRSLQCSRITIHKHLVISFILQYIVIIIMTEPYVTGRTSATYRDLDWMCKFVSAVYVYLILAGMFWMFIEGFFLHHSLVLGVFSTQPPFFLFYMIGWGLPFVIVLAWVIVLIFTLDTRCWSTYANQSTFYIVSIPFIAVIVVNFAFLISIIRVLVSKLRANNRLESANIRKAIKATVILMPLLGLTNIIFFTSPYREGGIRSAYQLTNAVLRSSQGIFVAVLYCFLNGEVRRVIKQKWDRFKIRHVMHTSVRRRSSRTSSFFMPSATENQQKEKDEQLRLLQANLALQAEQLTNGSLLQNQVTSNGHHGNGDAQFPKSKNNNNGDVRFCIGLDVIETERESVL